MTKHVSILETFTVTTQLGELTVHTPRTGETDVVDGPREHKTTYTKGQRATFSDAKSAAAFVAAHPGKAELAPRTFTAQPANCPQRILVATHFNDDGTCKCTKSDGVGKEDTHR